MRRLARIARYYLWAFPLLFTVAPLFASSPPSTNNTRIIAFVNVNVVAMDHDGIAREQTVLVRGATISEIGPTSMVRVPVGSFIIDGTGRYLAPGLADMHVHLDSLVHARPNFGDAPLFLAYGITTVLNLRGEPEHLTWRQRIRDGELLAPNLYTSGEFINEPRELTLDEVEREVESQFHTGYDVIKYHQIVDKDGRYLTTSGLSREAYMRMNEVAKRLGIPLLGHAPINLGLNALLEAHQSLAHVGEFVPLYFLPPSPKEMNRFFLAAGVSLLLLLVSCAFWLITGRARPIRKHEPAGADPVFAVRSAVFALTGLALVSFALSVLLILSGNEPLLISATIVFFLMLGLVLGMIGMTVKCCRGYVSSVGAKLHLTLVAAAGVAFLSSTGYWVPILWRSSDVQIALVADSARKSGIWVETTLNLYDTMGMSPQERTKLLQEPAFKALPADIREDWTATAGQDLLPRWQMILFRNYPRFTRRLAAALHKAGVPLLLGTDAMGATLAIPGASAHQELQLLTKIGLSPYEALKTATVNPAKFLGKEGEFGTINVGKRADLLLLSTDPLVDIHTLKTPVGVMVRGQWLTREELNRMLSSLTTESDRSQ